MTILVCKPYNLVFDRWAVSWASRLYLASVHGCSMKIRSDQFVHSFIGEPGQIRGISPFASVVEALSQTVSLQDAVLIAAHASASIVGVVTSDLPSADVARSADALVSTRSTGRALLIDVKTEVLMISFGGDKVLQAALRRTRRRVLALGGAG